MEEINKETTAENKNAEQPAAEPPKDNAAEQRAQDPQPKKDDQPKKPFYKSGIFWTLVATAAGAIGVGAAILLSNKSGDLAEAAATPAEA